MEGVEVLTEVEVEAAGSGVAEDSAGAAEDSAGAAAEEAALTGSRITVPRNMLSVSPRTTLGKQQKIRWKLQQNFNRSLLAW